MIKCFWQFLPKKVPPPNDNLSPIVRPVWHHHYSRHHLRHARKILIRKWTCIVVSGLGAGGLGVAAHHLAQHPAPSTDAHANGLFPSIIYAGPLNANNFASSYNLPEPGSSAAYLICGLFILVFLAFAPRVFSWCKNAFR